MFRIKDRDILKIFREIPDNTGWDHPTHWMRGGNVQLSRAFAEFAKADPVRAVRIIEQFEPQQQERAAGYALDALADDPANDELVLATLLDLNSRGFAVDEYRGSAARAVEKIVNRKRPFDEEVIDLIVGWLDLSPDQTDGVQDSRDSQSDDLKEGSILWGLSGGFALPGGNFTVLSALASILLNLREPGRDRYLAILEAHLDRERNPQLWRALLHRLFNAGRSTPEVVSKFIRRLFATLPEIVATRETATFLAYAQRWDDALVFDLIRDWPRSGNAFLERVYGELVGLVAITKNGQEWTAAGDAIVASGVPETRRGLTYAAANTWSDDRFRVDAGRTLVALLANSDKKLVAAALDVFRLIDDLPPDQVTTDLLRALAQPNTDLSAAPSHFIVERLQGSLPYNADLIATIGEKLVAAWRGELADMRTATVTAAPQLTDLALTLHRMGGDSRQAGVALFEAMIEIDAYGSRETLAEIDGRFGSRGIAARQALPRRRRGQPRARRAG